MVTIRYGGDGKYICFSMADGKPEEGNAAAKLSVKTLASTMGMYAQKDGGQCTVTENGDMAIHVRDNRKNRDVMGAMFTGVEAVAGKHKDTVRILR